MTQHAANPTPKAPDHTLTNEIYDVLKFIAMIFLPALGSLYFALAGLWNLPNAESVVGTITVVDTFLGGLLKVSTVSFDKSEAKYDGTVHITDPIVGPKTYQLELNANPENLDDKKQVVFKVNTVQ